MPFDTVAGLKSEISSFVFEDLFHKYYESVYRYVLAKSQSAYLAEETTQLTFIKLWQYRMTLKEDVSFETQLFRIVRTTLIDLLRKQDTQNKKLNGAAGIMHTSTNTVWEAISARELYGRIFTAIEAMPAVRKKVFTMSRLEEISNKEIAVELSISVKAVEFHITKAIHSLKKLFFH